MIPSALGLNERLPSYVRAPCIAKHVKGEVVSAENLDPLTQALSVIVMERCRSRNRRKDGLARRNDASSPPDLSLCEQVMNLKVVHPRRGLSRRGFESLDVTGTSG